VHPAKPTVGLLYGTRASLHGVIDNVARQIPAWQVAGTFAPVNSVAVRLEARQRGMPSDRVPVVLADGGAEHVNA